MTMKRLLAVCCALFVAVAFASPAVAAEPSQTPTPETRATPRRSTPTPAAQPDPWLTKAPARKTANTTAAPFVPGGSALSAAVSGGSSTSSQTGSKSGGGQVGKKVESSPKK